MMAVGRPLSTTVIVVAVAVGALAVLLVYLASRIRSQLEATHRLQKVMLDEYRRQHLQATVFGELAGMFEFLAHGLENGGLPPEVRAKIYAAGRDAIARWKDGEQPVD